MEIVIVPAWRRPDFLQACFARLLAADDPNLHYRITVDRGAAPSVAPVIARFVNKIGRRRAKSVNRAHNYRGNSYNTLSAYREALAEHPTLIHLVEEDILVGRDYFDFHRRAHELVPDAFAVSACRNQKYVAGHDPAPDDTAVYVHGSYQSIGVSFRPIRLHAILPHLIRDYFANPVRYCARIFPGSAINPNNAEQDGLLERLMEHAGLATVYGHTPRAYHAGFMGYHRKGTPPAGDVEQRAKAILRMTADELNAHAHSFPDHTTIPLDDPRQPVARVISWP